MTYYYNWLKQYQEEYERNYTEKPQSEIDKKFEEIEEEAEKIKNEIDELLNKKIRFLWKLEGLDSTYDSPYLAMTIRETLALLSELMNFYLNKTVASSYVSEKFNKLKWFLTRFDLIPTE